MIKIIFACFLTITLFSSHSSAKKVKFRKTQEVSFDGEDVDGVKRNPYGSYLAQKKGVDFAPLFKVKQKFDTSIRSSVDYVR